MFQHGETFVLLSMVVDISLGTGLGFYIPQLGFVRNITCYIECTIYNIHTTEIRVFFESDSYSVAEDSGLVTVCLMREGGSSDTLQVQVSTANLNPVDASGKP